MKDRSQYTQSIDWCDPPGSLGRGALTWAEWGDNWENADYTWEESGDLLITTLDTGEQRSLISIVNNVMSMWERLLNENGL